MIIVKIKDGLGNQMFQYALGRSLAIKNNDVLKLDISSYSYRKKKYAFRNYKLNNFSIVENIANKKELDSLRYANKILRKLKIVKKTQIIEKKQYNYDEKIESLLGNNYLDGYWQTEKYFLDIADILRKEFTLKKSMSVQSSEMFKIIEKINNSVSVHVRRGDYLDKNLSKSFYGICDLNYYEKAINLIKEKADNPVFFVFSDDIAWTKDNFKGEGFVFVSNPEIEDVEELILMSKCKHNIIANSSFSWWGAWLNNNFEKIVIAPKKWFNDKKANQNDILPERWIKI